MLFRSAALVAAYQSPRTVWPYFDWTDKDFVVYVNQEIASRIAAREQLTFESHIPKLEVIFRKPFERDSDIATLISHFAASANGSLTCLPKSHGVHLSICNQLCTLPQLYSSGSLTNHIKWLTVRAEEISRDDSLLRQEGLGSLDGRELVLACLRRGLFERTDCRDKFLDANEADGEIDDSGGGAGEEADGQDGGGAVLAMGEWSPTDLQDRLQQWLDFSARVHAVPPYVHPSLLLHAIALGIPMRKPTTSFIEFGESPATSGKNISDDSDNNRSGRDNSMNWKGKKNRYQRK
jgi:hypothetical protein